MAKAFSSGIINDVKKENRTEGEESFETLSTKNIKLLREFMIHPVVIEKTGKEFKVVMLTGILFVLLGIMLSVFSLWGEIDTGMFMVYPMSMVSRILFEGGHQEITLMVARYGIGIGVIVFIVGKFLAWWNHG